MSQENNPSLIRTKTRLFGVVVGMENQTHNNIAILLSRNSKLWMSDCKF